MKRIKTVAVVTVFALLVSGFLCACIYAWQFIAFQKAKENTDSLFAKFAQECSKDRKDPQQFIHQFMVLNGANLNSSFPYVAAILDENGSLLARTGDTLLAEGMQAKQTLIAHYSVSFSDLENLILPPNALYLDLTPFVTPEIKAQMHSILKEQHGGFCAVTGFSLYETEDSFIPVSVTMRDASGATKRTITFSDMEPTIVRTSANLSRLYIFSVCSDHKLDLTVAAMEENLSVMQAAAKECTKKDDLTMQRTLQSNSRFPTVLLPLSTEDGTVWFVLTYTYRPFIGALKWSVRYYAIALPVCAMLYAFALFLALRHLRRKAQLETSRYSFLSAAAHELKTPLSVILSSGECIRDGIAPEKTKEYSEMILAQGERMQGLISQMLQQNRLLSADSVKKTPFDLSVLLAEEAKKYLTAADQKDIILVMDIEPDVMILADRELIALAVDNYLSNAVKYAPEKAGVTVSLHRTGRKATVTVANTGSRIAKEDLPHIFEELYRADQVRSGGSGSGLGLSIARRIFELHGYRYGAASDETSTRFFFSAKETHRM